MFPKAKHAIQPTPTLYSNRRFPPVNTLGGLACGRQDGAESQSLTAILD